MKNIKYWLLAGILVVIATWVAVAGNHGQWFSNNNEITEQPDAKTEFRKLSERYLQQDSVLNMTGDIKLYDGESNQLKEQTAYQIIKEQGRLYSRLSYLQTFCDDQLAVQVDSVNKIVIVANAIGSPTNNNNTLQQIDGLFSDTAAFRVIGTVAGNAAERTLSFYSEFHPEIRRYHVTYDAVTYQMKRATIEWWKDAVVLDTTRHDRIWITKIDYHYLPAARTSVKNMMADIITVQNGKIQLTERYRDYQLHIATSQQP